MNAFKGKLLLIPVSFLLFISCGDRNEKGVYISFFAGDVKVKRSGGQEVPVQLKALVKDGDTYCVGEKSFLVLNGSEGLSVRIEPDTEIVIKSVEKFEKRELSLVNGRVLSRLKALKSGQIYMVKTPNSIASVRGTEFITKYEKGVTTVSVFRGVVAVKAIAGNSEKSVPADKTGIVEGDKGEVIIRDNNAVEKLELGKFAITPDIEKIEEKKAEDLKKAFEGVEEKSSEIEENINKISAPKRLTLDDLKKKYGKIDIVTLYNGKVIRGVIRSRGAVFRILTPGGMRTLNGKQVKNTRTQR